MPNLRPVPRVAAKRATRRRISKRRRSGHWLLAFKVAWLLERFRRRGRRRSSPSARQITLFVVLAGIAIALLRAVSRKAKSRPAPTEERASEVPMGPENAGNDTLAGERTLTDRVQREMFERADSPAQTGGSE